MSPRFRTDRGVDDGPSQPSRAADARLAPAPTCEVLHDENPVRPFFLTGGRTRTDQDIAFETIVTTTERGRAAITQLPFELADITRLAIEPQSVAELSAAMRIPITVARILCGDLVAAGHLDRSMPAVAPADDVDLIKRLIHGVRSL